MDIISKLTNSYKLVANKKASSDTDIELLKDFSKIQVPEDYVCLIEQMSEIELTVCKNRYIRIWGAIGCIEMNSAYKIQYWIPDSLAIGDDGNCNILIYANGNKGFGLYVVSLDDMETDEMVFISNTLSDLLIYNIGLKTIQNIW